MDIRLEVSLCRACLGSDLSTGYSDKTELMEKFQCITQLKLDVNSPFKLCCRCISRMKIAFDFRQECLVSASYFQHLQPYIAEKAVDFADIENASLLSDVPMNDDEMKLLFEVEVGYKSDEMPMTDQATEAAKSGDADAEINETSDLSQARILAYEVMNLGKINECNIINEILETDMECPQYVEENNEEKPELPAKNNDVDKLSNHFKEDTEENPKLLCLDCNKEFDNKLSLTKHFTTHLASHDCPVCGKTVLDSIELNDHMKMHLNETVYICEICNKSFSDRKALCDHMALHKCSKGYKCDTCDKAYSTEIDLKKHIIRHSGKEPLKCNFCSKWYMRNDLLVSHLRSHTGERPFACNVCGATFRQKCALKNHMCSHTGERPYKCEYCGRGFVQKLTLIKHTRRHTGERPLFCDKCGKSFRQIDSLKKHMETHIEGRVRRQKSVSAEKLLTCDKCGETFSHKYIFKKHLQSHKSERPYVCGVCGRGFKQSHTLIFHGRKHLEKSFACSKCDAKFRYALVLKRHILSKHSDAANELERTMHQCKICDEKFTSRENFETHAQQQHLLFDVVVNEVNPQIQAENQNESNENSLGQHIPGFQDNEALMANVVKEVETHVYTCLKCNAGFNNQVSYNKHMQEHGDIKPYQCAICGSGFTQNFSLKQHMLIHTGERPYKCEICDKSFTQGKSLTIHMRRHTGERPFECEYCDLRFHVKDALKRHTHNHHSGQQPAKARVCVICQQVLNSKPSLDAHMKKHLEDGAKMKCRMCEKVFKTRCLLEEHIRTHTGEKPFVCDECGSAFARGSSYTRHKKRHQEKNLTQ